MRHPPEKARYGKKARLEDALHEPIGSRTSTILEGRYAFMPLPLFNDKEVPAIDQFHHAGNGFFLEGQFVDVVTKTTIMVKSQLDRGRS